MARCYHIDSRDVIAWLAGQNGPVAIEQVAEGVDTLDRLMLVLVLGVLARLGYVTTSQGPHQSRLYSLTEKGRIAHETSKADQ